MPTFVAEHAWATWLVGPAFAALTPDGMEAMADAIRQTVDQSKFERQKSLKEQFTNPGLIDLKAASDNFVK